MRRNRDDFGYYDNTYEFYDDYENDYYGDNTFFVDEPNNFQRQNRYVNTSDPSYNPNPNFGGNPYSNFYRNVNQQPQRGYYNQSTNQFVPMNGTMEFTAVPGHNLNVNTRPLGEQTMMFSTPSYGPQPQYPNNNYLQQPMPQQQMQLNPMATQQFVNPNSQAFPTQQISTAPTQQIPVPAQQPMVQQPQQMQLNPNRTQQLQASIAMNNANLKEQQNQIMNKTSELQSQVNDLYDINQKLNSDTQTLSINYDEVKEKNDKTEKEVNNLKNNFEKLTKDIYLNSGSGIVAEDDKVIGPRKKSKVAGVIIGIILATFIVVGAVLLGIFFPKIVNR